jgi:hypothetical protein
VLGLLVDAHVDAALGQRVGGGETTDAAADDGHSEPIRAHGLLRRGLSTKRTFDTPHGLNQGLPPEPPHDSCGRRKRLSVSPAS